MAHRVGAIDIGTNTVLLLVAEGGDDGARAILEHARITRLGAGVDRTGELSEEAMARTVSALAECRALLDEQGTGPLDVVCTSAARDAKNGAEFLNRAQAALGVRPRIIDGAEEARLTFEGALSGLTVSGPVHVFDVGGGSTEIISGRVEPSGSFIDVAVSLDIGSVRLTERHVRADPPTDDDLERVREDVERVLAASSPAPSPMPRTVVGVAGTVTTLASLAQGLPVYDSARVHGSRLSASRVKELTARLASLPLAERRALSGLEPGRADVIVAGAVLVSTLLARLEAEELVVSDRGVRWGLARGLLGS